MIARYWWAPIAAAPPIVLGAHIIRRRLVAVNSTGLCGGDQDQCDAISVNYPNSLAMTPNGSRLFVTNGSTSAASVIDTSSKSVIATFGVGLLPTAVAVSPDGARAYVTNEFGLSVSVIDAGSNSVVNTIQSIGVYPVGIVVAAATSRTPPPTSPPTRCK